MKKNNNSADIAKIMMNPIRLRIIQYLAINHQGTTNEIQKELDDVPPASLYRHVKTLLDANLIIIAAENKVRGTIEKTYALNPSPVDQDDASSMGNVINTCLMQIFSEFNLYLERKDKAPEKDLICLTTSTMFLTEEEFQKMTQKIGEAIMEVVQNKPSPERKQRRITFISSPCDEE